MSVISSQYEIRANYFFFVDSLRSTHTDKRSLNPITERKNGQILVNGAWYWDFSSNDYLGLAQHPVLKKL